jgi:hypothetical protein
MEFELLVESEIVAEIANAEYISGPAIPADLSILENRKVIVWTEAAK